MIIFGWNHQTIWNVGFVFRQLCDHCHNEEYWVLMRRTTWFTLFFIPVIPYKTEWLLLCPVCKYGVELKSEQVEKLRPVAETNNLLATKQITEDEYRRRMNSITGSVVTVSEAPEATPIETKEIAKEIAATKTVFCGDCGKEIKPDGRFCTNCGSQVPQAV